MTSGGKQTSGDNGGDKVKNQEATAIGQVKDNGDMDRVARVGVERIVFCIHFKSWTEGRN